MARQLRTNLFVVSSSCGCSENCNICGPMGYKIDRDLNQNEIENLILAINFSVENSVVIPGGTVAHPNFNDFQQKIKKKLVYVFTFAFWLQHNRTLRQELYGNQIVLLFDRIPNVEPSIFPLDSTLTFVIDKANQDQLESFLNKFRTHFYANYCVPTNTLLEKEHLRMADLLKFDHNLIDGKYRTRYKIPFNHDAVDIRNASHTSWIFLPNQLFCSYRSNRDFELSIIIPFCNRSSFIQKVISFIDNNNLDKSLFEIILIDDGSSEEELISVLSHLKAFPNLNLQLHYVPRKYGITDNYTSNRAGPARNLGISIATGKIILFLDSDILIPKNFLKNLIELHTRFHVVLPIRQYLNEEVSKKARIDLNELQAKDLMTTPWDAYKDKLYSSQEWMSIPFPWLYCMTYCLSVTRKILDETGGFRTNFISYGFEDIDLGARLFKIPRIQYLNLKESVYHLYHFDEKNEYTLEPDLRYYQLVFSSSTFVAQNFPTRSPGLEKLTDFRSETQVKLFRDYLRNQRQVLNET